MKVLHLISGGDKGGAKTHVLTLLSVLMEDIDVRVVCFTDGVFYKEVKDTKIPSLLIKQKFRNDLTVVTKLAKHIREERYDIIHCHGARANFIALTLKKFVSQPMITTVHSDYRSDFTDGFYKRVLFTQLNTFALRFFDYYIAVSEDFKQMLVNRKFSPDLVYTVYNAIDFDKHVAYVPKEEFLNRFSLNETTSGKTIIGIVGRFDKVKGHEIFIKAAAEIYKNNPNVYFLLAGEGPEKANLENLAASLGISKNISFLGFVDDIFSFLNAIDINVLTSHNESFPYALLEGSKLKIATVSTAVGGIPDLIIDGETGYLAPAGDYNVLSEKILRLVDDPNLCEQMGNNLYTYARTNFSTDSMKKRHLEIYEDILMRHKNANKAFDVMLSGYYGFNNSGDEAILYAIIDSLRKTKSDIKIITLSKNPKETSFAHNVYSINRYNFWQIYRYMKRSRLFLNGGGNLLQDITSTQSLVYYTQLMKMAKRLGLNVMLYANGIGPLNKNRNVTRARAALYLCDKITLREPESFNELKHLNVSIRNASLSCDPTFILEPSNAERVAEIFEAEGLKDGNAYFAVSVRQWKYNDIDFSEKLASSVNKIASNYHMTPVFIPMQIPYDEIISRDIGDKLNTPYIVLHGVYNVNELMGVISKMKIVIGMRLHTLIYAVSVGIPVLGIAYDPKVISFLEYVNQPKYVNSNQFSAESVINLVDEIMQSYDNIKSSVNHEAEKLKSMSNGDAEIAVKLL